MGVRFLEEVCLLLVLGAGVNRDYPLEHIKDQAAAAYHLVRLRLALRVRLRVRLRLRVRVTLSW